MKASYEIRSLRKDEVPLLLEMCRAEGRHMGSVPEVETWLQIDQEAFHVAVDDQGQIIGSCCGIRLSPFHGYVGMYVVKDGHRGGGIGKQVWNAAIEHLGSWRNCGLSAVSHLFEMYRDKAGFSHVADWNVNLWKLGLNRYSALFKHLEEKHWIELGSPLNQNTIIRYKRPTKVRTVALSDLDDELIKKVVAYDAQLHSYDRSKIVRLTLTERKLRARIALIGDTVVGYGCIKPNLQGLWMITPLYADNEYIARMLLCDLVGSLSTAELDQGVVLKAPSNNIEAVNLLKKMGFERQEYSLKRCYTKYVFNVPTHCIFALHTSVFCTE